MLPLWVQKQVNVVFTLFFVIRRAGMAFIWSRFAVDDVDKSTFSDPGIGGRKGKTGFH